MAPRATIGAALGVPTAALKAAARTGASILVICPAGRRAEAVAAALKAATGGALTLQATNGGGHGIALREPFVVRAAKGSGDGRHIVPAGNHDDDDDEKGRAFVTGGDDDEKDRAFVTGGDDDEKGRAFVTGGEDDEKDRAFVTSGDDDEKHRAFVTGGEDDEKDRAFVTGGDDEEKGRAFVTGGGDDEKDRPFVTGGDDDEKDRAFVTGGEEDKDRVVVTGGEEEKAGELYRVGDREVFIPEMTLYELVMICDKETGRLLNRARPPLDKLHGLDILKESHQLIKEEMRKLEMQDVPVPGGGRRVAHRMVGLHLRVVAWAGKIEGVKPHHYLPGFLTTGQRYRLPSKNKRAGTLMELLLYSMMMASNAINPFLPEQVFDFTNYP